MKDITLISASYNTPHVTENMLKSFTLFHPDIPVLISENSTTDETKNILIKSNIPFLNSPGELHGPSVDTLFKSIKTKYALLVDTDVIFLKNHNDIFKQFIDMNLCLMGKVVGDRGGKKLYKRVNPWHMFVNVETITKCNIQFYDKIRLLKKDEIRYDIGSSFLEDIRKNKLLIGDVDLENVYFKHYEGMSWRVNRYKEALNDGNIDVNQTDTHNNTGLYNYGKHLEQIYKQETKQFDNLAINYTYV